MFKRFLRNESGATAIEYTLIAAAMAICLVLLMPMITDNLTLDAGNIATRITAYK